MLAYLEKWTEAYMVDGSDFELEAGTSVTTLAGQEHKLTFAAGSEGGQEQWQNILVQPGDAKIIIAKEVRLLAS